MPPPIVRWRKLGDPYSQYVVSSEGEVNLVLAPYEQKVSYLRMPIVWRPNFRAYQIRLQNESGGYANFLVHNLVALTFLGDRPENEVLVFLDGNHKNHRLSNLAYMTRTNAAKNSQKRNFISADVDVDLDPLAGATDD